MKREITKSGRADINLRIRWTWKSKLSCRLENVGMVIIGRENGLDDGRPTV